MCPCTTQHCTPARSRTAALQHPPCAVPRCAPAQPRPAPLRIVPLRRPSPRPCGAPSYASTPRLALCGTALTGHFPSAYGLWPPQGSPPAHPTAAAPRPNVPTHHQPRRITCTGPMRSRQRPSAPALARLRGAQPDRSPPLARHRPRAAIAPSAAAGQHPRRRRDPRLPRSTHPCHHVPTPRNGGPQRGLR